jgi:EAL domain-containing protein (putative c-di-GMP-specific phosphodiesterase class I)
MNSADIACNLAKSAGRNTVHLFDVSHDNSTEKRQDMLSVHQINNAIQNDSFILYKQDISPLQGQKTGQHFEILLRMIDAQGNIISPEQFLPIAERYHLCSKIDLWVINSLFNYLNTHQNELSKITAVSINLSAHSLIDSELEKFIIRKLTALNIPAKKICFEITETAAITNIKKARSFIDNIKSLGCKFALDDFGSGHSSYAYIKEFPIDTIKIDGSFISNIIDNPIDFATVKSICDIAKSAGQEIVAEFVENENIVEVLIELGIDYGQGYYFSRPKPLI